MLLSVFEVGIVVLVVWVGLALLVLLLRGAVRKVWPQRARAAEGERSPTEREEVRRRWAVGIGLILFAILTVNSVAFAIHTRILGGSADHSRREPGRYYVSEHGRYTEVTGQQWRAVRAHEIAVYITHALGFVLAVPLLASYSEHPCRRAEAQRDTGSSEPVN